jgi:hypothetical protein
LLGYLYLRGGSDGKIRIDYLGYDFRVGRTIWMGYDFQVDRRHFLERSFVVKVSRESVWIEEVGGVGSGRTMESVSGNWKGLYLRLLLVDIANLQLIRLTVVLL